MKTSLKDVYDESPEVITVEVDTAYNGVDIKISGYGTLTAEDGSGLVAMLENRDGLPFLVVWADIRQEEPTHIIPLAGADEARRIVD